ncbi:HNH endonuclease [Bifidobacterium callimiconis]|uniref:Restriction endonuclease n=1 Tax=Bifidobacterium callimiconis TaxID=2306973 RepID=A0A430FIR9_9BIFI|nr:HNH endonuclease [Bifidobacterium callimiconis]RSX52672.1 restriction endonuclease [Bifidobacterium callimiconis]
MTSQPTTNTRRTVLNRDGHKCIICEQEIGSRWSGYSVHHRRLRSHPFARLHEAENLVPLCGSGSDGCHGWVHAHTGAAYRLGYLVRMWADPAGVPVYYRRHGWQLLTADGRRIPCAPPDGMPVRIGDIKGFGMEAK